MTEYVKLSEVKKMISNAETTHGFFRGDWTEIIKKSDVAPDKLPTEMIEPRRKGHWVLMQENVDGDGNDLYTCSECDKGDTFADWAKVRYCWNCGAKMKGKEGEQ